MSEEDFHAYIDVAVCKCALDIPADLKDSTKCLKSVSQATDSTSSLSLKSSLISVSRTYQKVMSNEHFSNGLKVTAQGEYFEVEMNELHLNSKSNTIPHHPQSSLTHPHLNKILKQAHCTLITQYLTVL